MVNRRDILINGLVLAAASAAFPSFAKQMPGMTVYSSPYCGCCEGWVQHVANAGFTPQVHHLDDEALAFIKQSVGLAPHLRSCHTARIDGYIIEGHVPAREINRLLAERPDVVGLSIPGMPADAPGMGEGGEPFDVLLIHRDGTSEVYASYPI